MTKKLITVVETPTFLRKANGVLSEAERNELVGFIAANPDVGDVLVGGSGVRKVRFAAQGKGKSGGVRVIYYYLDDACPLFLLTVYPKSKKSNLDKDQKSELAALARLLKEIYHG